jgi:rhodanese-related sulfurtransferase
MRKLNNILIVVALLFTVSIATACNTALTTNSNSESTAIISDSTKPTDNKTSGKIIVDVRTIEEWSGDGHANCSVNIPLSDLSTKIEELKKYQEITLVCRSGNRANTAKSILEEAGLKNITNLGAWQNIQCK